VKGCWVVEGYEGRVLVQSAGLSRSVICALMQWWPLLWQGLLSWHHGVGGLIVVVV
jgi:hypothetical protein